MDTGKDDVLVPVELTNILKQDDEARAFFEGLSNGYKRGYCDWVGGAKQEVTRETRAQKALAMLKNKQKTLKTSKPALKKNMIKPRRYAGVLLHFLPNVSCGPAFW